MDANRDAYLRSFQKRLTRLYKYLKHTKSLPERERGFLEGYIEAGLRLGLVTGQELQTVIEEINFQVFGMTVAERRQKYPKSEAPLEDLLQIPTYIRAGKTLE